LAEPPLVPITAFYAGLLALIAIVLGLLIGPLRLRTGISILHGDNMELATRIRRHANFTESVPLALVLLGFLELNGGSPGLLHGLGIALLVSRIAHPFGLRHDDLRSALRGIGAGGTTLVTLIAAVMSIWAFVAR
jgi:uncharacterized membrane protein YecN with MAPEG domain